MAYRVFRKPWRRDLLSKPLATTEAPRVRYRPDLEGAEILIAFPETDDAAMFHQALIQVQMSLDEWQALVNDAKREIVRVEAHEARKAGAK